MTDYDTLVKTLRKERRSGGMVIHREPRQQISDLATPQEITSFIQQLQLTPIAHWHTVQYGIAKAIVRMILHQDLAYSTKIINIARAAELTNRWFSFFPEPATYYTNGTFEAEPSTDKRSAILRLNTWTPLTPATVDTGIFCITKQSMSIIWAYNND